MKHILGITRRCLNLKGAKAHKVEFDYLRLVYVVKELRRTDDEAKGYLLVMTPDIAEKAEKWKGKYQAGDAVEVIVAPLTQEMLDIIQSEVKNNTDGMVAGTIGDDVAGRADATKGRKVAEQLLIEMIKQNEPKTIRQTDKKYFPFGIQWDYYGTDIAE
jgi:hypothetical protein